MYLQPCDWIETDVDFKYVVDVYGRTDEGDVARLRLTGFKPYMYLRAGNGETADMVKNALTVEKKLTGLQIIKEFKLDAMQGFSNLQPIAVWKIQCTALWMFKNVSRMLKGLKIGTRIVRQEDIYEANLHPLLRLFHERDIQPASALEFEADEMDYEDDNIDVVYQCDYRFVKPFSNINIPLYVCAYDLEVYSESGQFPVSTNPSDQIIQVGVSFRWSDKLLESVARYVFVSGTCAPSADPNMTFVSCRNEKDLLKKFEKCIHDENPDILAGYNTFGFDDGYISDRAEYLNLPLRFGRADYNSWKEGCVKTEKKTFELASGKFAVRYMEVAGRLPIDLYLSMRREQNLDSYKLDNVASTFLRDKVLKIEGKKIYTKSTRGLFVGNLVRLDVITNTINPFREGHKFQVISLSDKWFEIDEEVVIEGEVEWSFGKDDVSAKEMFASHRGTPEQRAGIAKYCIQDCDLVLTLMAKLDTFVNARGMADVCRVPIQYVFLRGQGIKIFSAVVYNASKRNQIIMAQGGFEGDSSYEGAIVLPPKIGMYLDQPIPVLDFNSLYPSNMIAYNLSPDTLVYVKTFDTNGKKLDQKGVENKDYKVDEISYDLKDDDGNVKGRQTCGFIQPTDDPQTIGLLPLTLDTLLKKRKETRKLIEKTEDDAQKSVLNGLQLAYKVVANSVYGQCGSSTSPIRKVEVAACTTAAGRERLQFAKKVVESEFGAEVIYGDTDSIFIKFPTKDLRESIEMAKKAADRITSQCRKAHRIEYEKTFYPFVLFCRKRYMGMMYEDDVTKCKRKSMGIAIKRRDNAPIVKDIFGGALDIVMEHRDLKMAQRFVQDMLVKVLKNEMPIEKFIITKQLRDDYVTEVPVSVRNHISKGKPASLNSPKAAFNTIRDYALEHGLDLPKSSIAHRTLADKMEDRDKGNAPQVGDRLAYIYVDGRTGKQGERIEELNYAKEHKLKPDTEFYITNQLQNPLAQLFALGLEDLNGYVERVDYKRLLREMIEENDEEESTLKVLKMKEKELEKLMFMGAQYLKKYKIGPIDKFFRK